MSLSDQESTQFQQLSIHSLETFDREVSTKTDKADPDFERFVLLFDDPGLKTADAFDFKTLYEPEKEPEEAEFEPLVETDEQREKRLKSKMSGKKKLKGIDADTPLPEPVPPTSEEKGFQQGFESGLQQGVVQGEKKGYEQGFQKGEKEGFEKGRQEGFEKGQADGLKDGLAQGIKTGEARAAEDAVHLLSGLEQSLHTMDQTVDFLVDTYEEKLIDLIQKIARKVILTTIEIDDEVVRPMILDALKQLVQPEEIVLTVSPEDYEYIEMIKDDFFEQVQSLKTVSVTSDSSVSKADFRIETHTGEIVSDIDSRLDAVCDAVKAAGRR